MTTTELIEKLKTMPPDAEVGCIWDGALRTIVQFVYETKQGNVALADYNELVMYDDDRPKEGPFNDTQKHWHTPEDPNPEEY